ncbi:hypothetical protein Tco_0790744 [Tanacetum coccineum]
MWKLLSPKVVLLMMDLQFHLLLLLLRRTEATKDKVQNTSLESTAHIQPPFVQDSILEPEVDYDVDPRVPLILRRPFLRTARTLIDVYGEELTLRVDDEAIMFKVGQTSRHSRSYKMVNQVSVIDVACEEYAQEMLGFLDNSTSGNPTPSDPIIASFSSSFTHFEGGDFILEEIDTGMDIKNGQKKRQNRTKPSTGLEKVRENEFKGQPTITRSPLSNQGPTIINLAHF